eukprot:801156-Pyramimonas_sp.AAC.1
MAQDSRTWLNIASDSQWPSMAQDSLQIGFTKTDNKVWVGWWGCAKRQELLKMPPSWIDLLQYGPKSGPKAPKSAAERPQEAPRKPQE